MNIKPGFSFLISCCSHVRADLQELVSDHQIIITLKVHLLAADAGCDYTSSGGWYN